MTSDFPATELKALSSTLHRVPRTVKGIPKELGSLYIRDWILVKLFTGDPNTTITGFGRNLLLPNSLNAK